MALQNEGDARLAELYEEFAPKIEKLLPQTLDIDDFGNFLVFDYYSRDLSWESSKYGFGFTPIPYSERVLGHIPDTGSAEPVLRSVLANLSILDEFDRLERHSEEFTDLAYALSRDPDGWPEERKNFVLNLLKENQPELYDPIRLARAYFEGRPLEDMTWEQLFREAPQELDSYFSWHAKEWSQLDSETWDLFLDLFQTRGLAPVFRKDQSLSALKHIVLGGRLDDPLSWISEDDDPDEREAVKGARAILKGLNQDQKNRLFEAIRGQAEA